MTEFSWLANLSSHGQRDVPSHWQIRVVHCLTTVHFFELLDPYTGFPCTGTLHGAALRLTEQAARALAVVQRTGPEARGTSTQLPKHPALLGSSPAAFFQGRCGRRVRPRPVAARPRQMISAFESRAVASRTVTRTVHPSQHRGERLLQQVAYEGASKQANRISGECCRGSRLLQPKTCGVLHSTKRSDGPPPVQVRTAARPKPGKGS